MKKYFGLMLLVALTGSSLFGFKAVAGDTERFRPQAGVGDADLRTLDQRLASRIDEQKELLGVIEKLLGMDFKQQMAQRPPATSAMAGTLAPPAPPRPAAVVAAAVKPAEPAWWSRYRPSMAYVSGADSYAVLNGKLVTLGQTLDGDVLLERVGSDEVVLRHGRESHVFVLKN